MMTCHVQVGEWDPLTSLVVEPDVVACLVVGGGTAVFRVRPGFPAGPLVAVLEWARSRAVRLFECGPEPDGWQVRADGAWQLWVRAALLPCQVQSTEQPEGNFDERQRQR